MKCYFWKQITGSLLVIWNEKPHCLQLLCIRGKGLCTNWMLNIFLHIHLLYLTSCFIWSCITRYCKYRWSKTKPIYRPMKKLDNECLMDQWTWSIVHPTNNWWCGYECKKNHPLFFLRKIERNDMCKMLYYRTGKRYDLKQLWSKLTDLISRYKSFWKLDEKCYWDWMY